MIISNNYDYVKYTFVAVLTSWQERYPKDATYHRLALAVKHPAVGRVDLAEKYCGLQLGKGVAVVKEYYYIPTQ